MKKWEYHIEEQINFGSGDEFFLDELGDQGWELVSVFKNEDGDVVCIYKRPKQDA